MTFSSEHKFFHEIQTDTRSPDAAWGAHGDAAADWNENAGGTGGSLNGGPGAFVDRDGTDKGLEDDIRVLVQVAIRRVRHVDNVTRLDFHIRGPALQDVLIIHDRNFRIRQRPAHN